jgi:hypothetical protein
VKTPHSFRGAHRQCRCLWCGKRRGTPCCPVTGDMRVALSRFVFTLDGGHRWRWRLSLAWLTGEDLGDELRQLRNIVGPFGLRTITLGMLREARG